MFKKFIRFFRFIFSKKYRFFLKQFRRTVYFQLMQEILPRNYLDFVDYVYDNFGVPNG